MHMNKQYDHRSIEKKWRSIWNNRKVYEAEPLHSSDKPKYYVLGMFPYPSGIGLHIGHALAYTVTDVAARYKRLKGFNVLNPMGWDSFGLPAEQFAMKIGRHPSEITIENINNFKKQLQQLGCSYDWGREIATSEASYYKWTQEIFVRLYNAGLAYEDDIEVLFCPQLGTVMSNEEVQGGVTFTGHEVIKAKKRQWLLKITDYADQLLQDLSLLDWPDFLKEAQRNWIGKSHGCEISFEIEMGAHKDLIKVFSTRPDTISGVTAIAVAVGSTWSNMAAEVDASCNAYIKRFDGMKARELAAQQIDGIKTPFVCIHPISNKRIPVVIANYVISDYGHGAVMCVPSCDDRDRELAEVLGLDITEVYDSSDMMLDGGICDAGTPSGAAKVMATNILEDKKVGTSVVKYKLRDWVFSRQRYWGEPIPVLHFDDGSTRALKTSELPLVLPDMPTYDVKANEMMTPLERDSKWINYKDPISGAPCKRDSNVMPQWAGSSWYYLRFCDPQNNDQAWSKEAENHWMPVDLYVGGAEHAVLHLLYARFWHKALYDMGLVSTSEPFKKLKIHGLVYASSYKDSNNRYYPADEVEEDGNGNFTHHTCNENLIRTYEKMSKSKLNGVAPDEVIDIYGADAFRMYLLFMGPIEQDRKWETKAVYGCRRFLCRMLSVVQSPKVQDERSKECSKITSLLIDKVGRAYENLKYNIVVSSFMEALNALEKLDVYDIQEMKKWIVALSPIAPYIAAEMWSMLDSSELWEQSFPLPDPSLLVEVKCTYAVQIQGKFRGVIDTEIGKTMDEVVDMVKKDPSFEKYHSWINSDKVVFVQNRIVNFL